jgi:hypothetical protein
MGEYDINIRNDEQAVRGGFNALAKRHGLTQQELVAKLTEFARSNSDQFEREQISMDRNRKHDP